MQKQDFPDASLLRLTAATVVAIVLWFVIRGVLPEMWRTPGSPALYFTGVAGLLLLLVPVAFVLVKRGGHSANPVGWFNAHIVCSLMGMVLIAIHSGGFLRRPPALLLLALLALAALGAGARFAAHVGDVCIKSAGIQSAGCRNAGAFACTDHRKTPLAG
jgi:hypothetical protein